MINTMTCSPSEAISAINALWPLKLSVMLWGSPGVGKSGLVTALARRREAKLRDVRLSQMYSDNKVSNFRVAKFLILR
jgi:MoxR-like ATPase